MKTDCIRHRPTRRPRLGQTIVTVTVSCALIAFVCAGCAVSGGLSESSTCKEFLAAPSDQQQSITQQLAGKYHKPDYATPLGMPAVPYYCAANPDNTLGHFFKNAQ